MNAVSLKDLRLGQSAEVVAIASSDSRRLVKLSAFGIVPGSIVTLEQRYPACILRIGETLLSLDGEVLEEIIARGL